MDDGMMMISGILDGSHTFHDGRRIDADHRRITSNIVDKSHGDVFKMFQPSCNPTVR
jgi:hypothetical protein